MIVRYNVIVSKVSKVIVGECIKEMMIQVETGFSFRNFERNIFFPSRDEKREKRMMRK